MTVGISQLCGKLGSHPVINIGRFPQPFSAQSLASSGWYVERVIFIVPSGLAWHGGGQLLFLYKGVVLAVALVQCRQIRPLPRLCFWADELRIMGAKGETGPAASAVARFGELVCAPEPALGRRASTDKLSVSSCVRIPW